MQPMSISYSFYLIYDDFCICCMLWNYGRSLYADCSSLNQFLTKRGDLRGREIHPDIWRGGHRYRVPPYQMRNAIKLSIGLLIVHQGAVFYKSLLIHICTLYVVCSNCMYSLWWQSEIERREFGNFQVVVLALMQFHEPGNTLMFSLSAEFVL